MDHTAVSWLWLIAGGALLGLFFKPGKVVRFTLGGALLALAGSGLSLAFSQDRAATLLGVAALVILVSGGFVTAGALLCNRALNRRAHF